MSFIKTGVGQSTGDLIQIFDTALKDNKLPKESILLTSSLIKPRTDPPYLILKEDLKFNLKSPHNLPESSHVWIFDYPEIFELNIISCLVITNITKGAEKMTISYKTVKFPNRSDTSIFCHTGKIVAIKNQDSWTIKNSTFNRSKCEIDSYGLKKKN